MMDFSSEQNPGKESDTACREVCISPAEAERIAERVRYLFRLAGDSPPARELEKQLLAYRLGMKSE